MAENKDSKGSVRELWGVEFPVVTKGLAEEHVVSYVNSLLRKGQKQQTDDEKRSALLRLAEQTVGEADKMGEAIREQARKDAEAEAAKILADGADRAREKAKQIIRSAEKDSTAQSNATAAKAAKDAQVIIEKSQRESHAILQTAKTEAEGIDTQTQATVAKTWAM